MAKPLYKPGMDNKPAGRYREVGPRRRGLRVAPSHPRRDATSSSSALQALRAEGRMAEVMDGANARSGASGYGQASCVTWREALCGWRSRD